MPTLSIVTKTFVRDENPQWPGGVQAEKQGGWLNARGEVADRHPSALRRFAYTSSYTGRQQTQKAYRSLDKPLILLVGREGFEPSTNGLRVSATQRNTTNNNRKYIDLGPPVYCLRLWITGLFCGQVRQECATGPAGGIAPGRKNGVLPKPQLRGVVRSPAPAVGPAIGLHFRLRAAGSTRGANLAGMIKPGRAGLGWWLPGLGSLALGQDHSSDRTALPTVLPL